MDLMKKESQARSRQSAHIKSIWELPTEFLITSIQYRLLRVARQSVVNVARIGIQMEPDNRVDVA